MLLDECQITAMFGLSNEKYIFEEVHHAQKFCLLVFEKGGITTDFEAAFRINPREAISPLSLGSFLNSPSLHIRYPAIVIDRASPDSRSIMEFKHVIDIGINNKLLNFPLLGTDIPLYWNIKLRTEFHMTNDSHLFKTENKHGRLPLYEGKMIWQFEIDYEQPRYWVDEAEGRNALLGRDNDSGQLLNYQNYRLGFRAIASNTNERSLIAAVLPSQVFTGNSLVTSIQPIDGGIILFISALTAFSSSISYIDIVI
jgi:hypothetical protein